MIHAQRETASGIGAGGAEFALESLGNRLQGREAVAGLDGIDADATGIEMIDRRKHPDPALVNGFDSDSVGGPHIVQAIRGDRSVVQIGHALRTAIWRQQGVLAGAPDAEPQRGTRMSRTIRSRAQPLR